MRLHRDEVFGGNSTRVRSQYQYALALWLVGALLALASVHDVEYWKATHWAFNYGEGYVKRALVGTFYQFIEYPVTQQGVITAYLVVAGGVIALFIWLVTTTFGPSSHALPHQDFTAAAVGLWLVTAPGFIPQLFHDMGRFDVFGILCLLASALVVVRRDKKEAFLAVLALSCVSIYIHEGFYFWIPPVAIALWIYRHHQSRRDTALVALFAVVLTANTGYSGLSTYAGSLSLDETMSAVGDQAAFPVDQRAVEVHFRSFAENVDRAWERGWSEDRVERLALAVPVFIPYLVFFGVLAREIRRVNSGCAVRLGLLFASVLAPAALFVLGSDFGRWFSMINVGAVAVILFLARCHPNTIRNIPSGAVWLVVVATVMQANLGPYGIEWIFPQANIWPTIEAIRALG